MLKEFVRILFRRCPYCGEKLSCENDNTFEYGLWYCSNCNKF